MTEEFLCYIWKNRLFEVGCKTTDGREIEIIKTGEANRDAGPDFINAKIKIDDTIWAGNVEVHVNSSDWIKHKHTSDKSYKNVILHVVYNDDVVIYRNSQQSTVHGPQTIDHNELVNANKISKQNKLSDDIIPAIELKEKYDEKLFDNYKELINSKNAIPCQKIIANVDKIVIRSWLESLLVERLENKTEFVNAKLRKTKNNYEQSFYILLARNFGFKLNSDTFEMLANATPFETFAKHKDNLFQIETILFGQSGMLDKDFNDEYPNQLKKEYKYLKHKLSLEAIQSHLWKFLRLRPANFPTIRISQFAYLIKNNDGLLSRVLEAKEIRDIEDIFKLKTSEYWETHYTIDKEVKRTTKTFGNSSLQNIIINTIVPFLFIYGVKKDIFAYKEKALKLLEQLPAEKNRIIEMWEGCGIKAENAFDSQALIELKNEYCVKLRCLDCRIGNFLLKAEVRSPK